MKLLLVSPRLGADSGRLVFGHCGRLKRFFDFDVVVAKGHTHRFVEIDQSFGQVDPRLKFGRLRLRDIPLFLENEITIARLKGESLVGELTTLRILANGFIVTSLVWASALAAIIDRRLARAAAFFLVAALFTIFGVMHSPLPGSPLFLPWQLAEEAQRFVYQFALGYLLVAALLLVWGLLSRPELESADHS